ncbi:MAG TPA: signal peptide peptidase SppA [Verrucomicrobiota bacterium]|jgi:protease-4|nr:signal peptide peptidase SppA [Verrucomicrobiota bacterium]HRT09478.1 signal peptide peptidase SppA [Candidatus Paceibacterota bacterium]HRT55959.1 signal peptide peptidase SppA [Candidatus Paceibacterota bacterium]
MVFAFILLALLAISMLYNLQQFFGSLLQGGRRYAQAAGPKLEEVVREDNGARDKVALIELTGIITSDAYDGGGYGMVDVIQAQLDRAAEDDQVRAVLLKVDSPGGEVLAADELYRAISRFQKETGKPVIASMGSVAASGGYYVSAACRWIVANELTLTGSIGVIMQSYNYRGLMNKVGLQPQTYKSGRFKDMLSGSREPSEIPAEERQMLQSLIDQVYLRFKEVVASGRELARQKNQNSKAKGRELRADWTEYADGRVLSGLEAYKLGFVDELGNFRDAFQRSLEIAGVEEANLVEYQLHVSFSDLLRLFGKTEARTLKVDVGLDLPKLRAGQLYFLSSSLLQ